MSLFEDLSAILACAQSELEDCGLVIPPKVFVAPANPAFDNACGQLWVRPIRSGPTVDFPVVETLFARCGTELATQIGLGIIRCSSGLKALESGNTPPAADITADAHQATLDMGALYRALACCFPALENQTVEIAVEEWTAFEPDGGVYGGEWTAWLTSDLQCEITSPGSP